MNVVGGRVCVCVLVVVVGGVEGITVLRPRIRHMPDDAIGDAYSAIVEAARALDHACEKSKNFQDIKVLQNIGMDRAFDNLEHYSFGEISEKVEEIFEVEIFSHHHA